LLPGTPPTDGLSKATQFGVGWAPRWKGTAAIAWSSGPLVASFSGRYLGRYLDYQDYLPNTNEIGNTWIFDVNARFETGKVLSKGNGWLAGSYVAVGAVNLLNKTPPFSNNFLWYDYRNYDARGRYLYLNVGTRL